MSVVVRMAAVAAILLLIAPNALAGAVPPPVIDPAALPADGPPSPEVPMQQEQPCAVTGVLPDSDPQVPSAAQTFMNPPQLWASAGRGQGITVALIDSGAIPSPRLPHLRGGGDYLLAGGDGLSDCDAHGTIVASIIGAAPVATDAFTGIAPDADLISIRNFSQTFYRQQPPAGDSDALRHTDAANSLARAIVHAANLGAGVINISGGSCIPATEPADLAALGAAVRYAAVDKDAVIVVAAANVTADCPQNPAANLAASDDPRNWAGVVTIDSPAWYSDYVLTVSATADTDQPAAFADGNLLSLRGPWIGVGAPGVWVQGLNNQGDFINGITNPQTHQLEPISGTSYAAAYTSGLAVLIRAKFPHLTAAQVIQKIESTADSAHDGLDNTMGHGVISPLAALNSDQPFPDDTPPTAASAPSPQPSVWSTALWIGAALSVLAGAGLFAGIAWRRRNAQPAQSDKYRS